MNNHLPRFHFIGIFIPICPRSHDKISWDGNRSFQIFKPSLCADCSYKSTLTALAVLVVAALCNKTKVFWYQYSRNPFDVLVLVLVLLVVASSSSSSSAATHSSSGGSVAAAGRQSYNHTMHIHPRPPPQICRFLSSPVVPSFQIFVIFLLSSLVALCDDAMTISRSIFYFYYFYYYTCTSSNSSAEV